MIYIIELNFNINKDIVYIYQVFIVFKQILITAYYINIYIYICINKTLFNF